MSLRADNNKFRDTHRSSRLYVAAGRGGAGARRGVCQGGEERARQRGGRACSSRRPPSARRPCPSPPLAHLSLLVRPPARSPSCPLARLPACLPACPSCVLRLRGCRAVGPVGPGREAADLRKQLREAGATYEALKLELKASEARRTSAEKLVSEYDQEAAAAAAAEAVQAEKAKRAKARAAVEKERELAGKEREVSDWFTHCEQLEKELETLEEQKEQEGAAMVAQVGPPPPLARSSSRALDRPPCPHPPLPLTGPPTLPPALPPSHSALLAACRPLPLTLCLAASRCLPLPPSRQLHALTVEREKVKREADYSKRMVQALRGKLIETVTVLRASQARTIRRAPWGGLTTVQAPHGPARLSFCSALACTTLACTTLTRAALASRRARAGAAATGARPEHARAAARHRSARRGRAPAARRREEEEEEEGQEEEEEGAWPGPA